MTKAEETISRLDAFLTDHQLPYSMIGGIAMIAHGYQRFTQDIDIVIATDVPSLRGVSALLLTQYVPRKENPVEFMERNFVLPVTDQKTGVPIDISAGLGGFDQAAVKRAKRVKFGKASIPLCSFEDMIIYKLAANRLRDRADLEFLITLKKKIDLVYLRRTAAGFIDLERSDILESVNRFFPEK